MRKRILSVIISTATAAALIQPAALANRGGYNYNSLTDRELHTASYKETETDNEVLYGDQIEPERSDDGNISAAEEWIKYGDQLYYEVNDDGTVNITDCDRDAEGSIEIPSEIEGKRVTSIGWCAFNGCSSLTSITLPDSVTSIGNWAFYKCDSLTDVYYTGTKNDWNKINIGSKNECLTNATIHYNCASNDDSTTAKITKVDNGDSYTFTVDAADKYGNCFVYAAVYGSNGVELSANRVRLDTSDPTKITVDKSNGAAKAKVFIWTNTMHPVIEDEEFGL